MKTHTILACISSAVQMECGYMRLSRCQKLLYTFSFYALSQSPYLKTFIVLLWYKNEEILSLLPKIPSGVKIHSTVTWQTNKFNLKTTCPSRKSLVWSMACPCPVLIVGISVLLYDWMQITKGGCLEVWYSCEFSTADFTIYTPGIGTLSLSLIWSVSTPIHQSPFSTSLGTHHCWVNRGDMVWEVCLTPLNITTSMTQTLVVTFVTYRKWSDRNW